MEQRAGQLGGDGVKTLRKLYYAPLGCIKNGTIQKGWNYIAYIDRGGVSRTTLMGWLVDRGCSRTRRRFSVRLKGGRGRGVR